MNTLKKQQGATLLISLVMLALMGIVAASVSQMANSNYKMADIYIDQQTAYEGAEKGIIAAQEVLANMTIEANCDSANSSCFMSKFIHATGKCDQGFCFDGTYSNTNTCTTNDASQSKALHQDESNWANAASLDANTKYLIEFRCYMMNSSNSATALAANKNSSYWRPLFRISSLHVDATTGARTMVQLNEFKSSIDKLKLDGIFSVNGDIVNIGGTNIGATFCEHCTDADVANPNLPNVTIDPNESSGVAYGGDIQYGTITTNYLTNPDGSWMLDSNNQVMTSESITTSLTPPTNNQLMGGKLSNDGYHDYQDAPKDIGTKTNDEYFAQYFGTTNRAEYYKKVQASGQLTTLTAQEFNAGQLTLNPAPTKDKPQVIVIKDVPAEGLDFTASGLGIANENTIIIVEGDLNAKDLAATDKFGLLYVAGDIDWSGSQFVQGVIAVEGTATIRTSLNLVPKINPADLTEKLTDNSGSPHHFSSWMQPSIQF